MSKITRILSQADKREMRYLLIVLVSFVVLDGFLTEYLIGGRQMVREANPFLEPLVGETGFMILKIAGALLCAFILWDIYRRFPRVAVIATWIGIVGYGVILIWNASLFLLH